MLPKILAIPFLLAIPLSISAAETALAIAHVHPINVAQVSGNRAITRDTWANWVLWDTDLRARLAEGKADAVNLAGDLAMVRSGQTIRVLDAATGGLRSEFQTSALYSQPSRDGKWILCGLSQGLEVRDDHGNVAFSATGRFAERLLAVSGDTLFAPSKDLDSLHAFSLSLDSLLASFVPKGLFHSWSTDMKHFLTKQGTVVRAYDRMGAQTGIFDIGGSEIVEADGAFLAVHADGYPQGILKTYRLEAPSVPPKEYAWPAFSLPVPSNPPLAIFSGDSNLIRVHLDDDSVRMESYAGTIRNSAVFGEDGKGDWIVGEGVSSGAGAVFIHTAEDSAGKSHVLNPGVPMAIEGNPAGGFVVTTTSGEAYLYKVEGGHPIIHDTIRECRGKPTFTADGQRLFFLSTTLEHASIGLKGSLSRYSLATRKIEKTWEFRDAIGGSVPKGHLHYFSISPDGKKLSRAFYDEDAMDYLWRFYVTDAETDSLLFQTALQRNSSNGVTTNGVFPGWNSILTTEGGSTKIYRNGQLADVVDGTAAGWLDSAHFLTVTPATVPGTRMAAHRSIVYDADGNKLQDAYLNTVLYEGFSRVSDSTAFIGPSGNIYDLRDGSVVSETLKDYQHPLAIGDAVGSEYVAYHVGNLVLFEKWHPELPTELAGRFPGWPIGGLQGLRYDRARGIAHLRLDLKERTFFESHWMNAAGRRKGGEFRTTYAPGKHDLDLKVPEAAAGPLFLQWRLNGKISAAILR